MTRMGSNVRSAGRSVRRRSISAFDIVVRPETGSNVLLSRLAARAQDAGASASLVEYAIGLSAQFGVRTSIAALRLLQRVGTGNRSAITALLSKLKLDPSDDLMWDAMTLAGFDSTDVRHDPDADLVHFFEPEIRRGFVTDGYSQVFEWLLSGGRVSNDSPDLLPLLDSLISSAVERRAEIEGSRANVSVPLVQSVYAAFTGVGNPHRVFLSGASLLAHELPTPIPPGFGGVELSTFASLSDVLVDLPDGFVLLNRRGNHVILQHIDSGSKVTLAHIEQRGDRMAHGNGQFTRWYTAFELNDHDFNGTHLLTPADSKLYLDERFGDWRSQPFFYHNILDAPNTTIDQSLEGLLFVYSKLTATFREGSRHYADEWAKIMRDRFGIEYSNFVPSGGHRKVLATPVTSAEICGRQVRLVIADFSPIDAEFIEWLDRQRDDKYFVVAAVTGNRHDASAIERLALANSLAPVNSAVLIETEDDLNVTIGGVKPSEAVMHPNAVVRKAT